MKKWRCTVCGYVHEGNEPPEFCPICGEPKSVFVEEPGSAEVGQTASGSAAPVEITGSSSSQPIAPLVPPKDETKKALFALSYGVFVVSSKKDGKFNAQICNTVFQVTDGPPKVAIGINKNNLTHEFIAKSSVLAVTILGKAGMEHVKRFGFQSGRSADKFKDLEYTLSPELHLPVIPGGVAYLELKVRPDLSVDVGAHTLYIAEVVGGARLNDEESITYDYYRKNRTP